MQKKQWRMQRMLRPPSRYRTLFFIGGAVLCFLVFTTVLAQGADTNEIAVLKLLKDADASSINSIMGDALRSVGFAIIKFLGQTVDTLYQSIGDLYRLLTFGSSKSLTGLSQRYETLYKIFFIVSLVFLGVYLIVKKSATELNTVNCILVIAVLMMAFPLVTQKLSNLTIASADYAKNQWVQTSKNAKVTSIASGVVLDSLVDLKRVDANVADGKIKGFAVGKPYHTLSTGTKDWRYLTINTPMEYSGDGIKQGFWDKELIMQEGGKFTLSDMSGFWGIGDSKYYRYQITSWFSVIALLLVIVVVLAMAGIKCALLVWEIAQSVIFIPFVAVTDIASGQRIKEAIKGYLSLFLSIFLCVALLGVYFAGISFIGNNLSGTFPKLLAHIALAWATINGPDQLERIFGVDVGVKSGWKLAAGAAAGAGAAMAAGRTAAGTAKKAGKAAFGAGSLMVGKAAMQQATDKAKAAPGKAVRSATDGKGLVGLGRNIAKGAQDKMTPKDSSQGLEKEAKAAGAFGSVTQKSGLAQDRKVQGDARQKSAPFSAGSKAVSPGADREAPGKPTKNYQPKRTGDNLSRIVRTGQTAQTDTVKNQAAYDRLQAQQKKK